MMATKRRRHHVSREPNGRPQREQETPPALVRRLRDAALRGLREPEWASELGRLYLERSITAEMYAAGRRWAQEAATYRGAIGVREVRSAALERGSMGSDADPDSDEGRARVRRDENAMERFFAAHAALVAAGMMAEAAVRSCCEEGFALAGMAEYRALRLGLSTLAAHYGIDKSGK
jgi:hypothetical protein